MTMLHLLSVAERESFFEAAAEHIHIPTAIIEKDFWVVWTLERLFTLPDLKNHLTFKGGTSLSKVYHIIQRFSEDVDLSIAKEFFGFSKINDPEQAISKNQRRLALANLSSACAQYVQNDLIFQLKTAMTKKLETAQGWHLDVDRNDPDGQTLQFQYPTATEKNKYIRPSVKIELGARSEHWPVSMHPIQSYVRQALGEKISEVEIVVQVLDATRTFWEKATILHQYAHLPKEKILPLRTSRHYYDFYCLLNSDIKKAAMKNTALLERVAAHKNIYFASGWASYQTAKQGSLKLSPPLPLFDELEKDFRLMRDMFFGNIPHWDEILENIRGFEVLFNNIENNL